MAFLPIATASVGWCGGLVTPDTFCMHLLCAHITRKCFDRLWWFKRTVEMPWRRTRFNLWRKCWRPLGQGVATPYKSAKFPSYEISAFSALVDVIILLWFYWDSCSFWGIGHCSTLFFLVGLPTIFQSLLLLYCRWHTGIAVVTRMVSVCLSVCL